MSTTPSQLIAVGMTDTGALRDHNEDSYLINEKLGLLLVADGMGGHDVGEIASRRAINEIENYLRRHIGETKTEPDGGQDILVQEAVSHANSVVHTLNREKSLVDGTGMGTTIVGVWYSSGEGRAVIFHIGDSRIYRLHDRALLLLSRDHTHYQEWLDTGSVGSPPPRSLITQALGPWPTVQMDITRDTPSNGDIYLLCSDGLTDMLDDEEIKAVLAKDAPNKNKVRMLVDEANRKGGRDNITVVVGGV